MTDFGRERLEAYDGLFVVDLNEIPADPNVAAEAMRHIQALRELGAGAFKPAQQSDREIWATDRDFHAAVQAEGPFTKRDASITFNGIRRLLISRTASAAPHARYLEVREAAISVRSLEEFRERIKTHPPSISGAGQGMLNGVVGNVVKTKLALKQVHRDYPDLDL